MKKHRLTEEPEVLLNCTRCHSFEAFTADGDHVVRCVACGKKHSRDSLHAAYPGKDYNRDEAGNLTEDTP